MSNASSRISWAEKPLALVTRSLKLANTSLGPEIHRGDPWYDGPGIEERREVVMVGIVGRYWNDEEAVDEEEGEGKKGVARAVIPIYRVVRTIRPQRWRLRVRRRPLGETWEKAG
jgi:hypothetical protein